MEERLPTHEERDKHTPVVPGVPDHYVHTNRRVAISTPSISPVSQPSAKREPIVAQPPKSLPPRSSVTPDAPKSINNNIRPTPTQPSIKPAVPQSVSKASTTSTVAPQLPPRKEVVPSTIQRLPTRSTTPGLASPSAQVQPRSPMALRPPTPLEHRTVQTPELRSVTTPSIVSKFSQPRSSGPSLPSIEPPDSSMFQSRGVRGRARTSSD